MITEKNNVFYCDCGFSFQRGRSGAHDCAEGLRIKLAESEARCAVLAAENAGLKHSMAVTLEHVSVTDAEQAGVVAMIINDALHNSETPVTDTFLAELRASAIEELMEKSLWDTANCLHGIGAFDKANDRKAVQGIIRDELKERVTEFAAQLRKGVQL
ncbi:Uncharacterised protein [Enterobacter ludwigii]|uniref:hypothetical protein n=1 Tax=Enterobacter ludwigii TaxID=299767 RepID=UPI0012576849|nr:hypothetical protein [Enterobacter ludwigii]VAG26215.1 Uncharacterised protein [Enterobacter ludwigii]